MDSDDYLLSPSQEDEMYRDLGVEGSRVCSQLELEDEGNMIDVNPYVGVAPASLNSHTSPELGIVKVKSFDTHLLTLNSPSVTTSVTCKMPSVEDYSGPLNFTIELPGLDAPSGKAWIYSPKLNKVFINIFKILPLRFQWDQNMQIGQLYVRAMLVYTSAQYFQEAVERCRHHASPIDEFQNGANLSEHVIRSEHCSAVYHVDSESLRRSVTIPLDRPQPGDDTVTAMFTFHCKNSCSSGMNRRATQIIFTLENELGVVMGRRLLKVRICSCPKRDKGKEEEECGEVRPLKRPMRGSDTIRKRQCIDNTVRMFQIPVLRMQPFQAALQLLLGELQEYARQEERELNDQEKQIQGYYRNMLDNTPE